MMIYAGMSVAVELGKGQARELRYGVIGRRLAGFDLFDERSQRWFIHRPIVARIPIISSVGRILS